MKLALSLFLPLVFALADTVLPPWRASLGRAIQLRDMGSPDAEAAFIQAAAEARQIPDGGPALVHVGNELAADHQMHGRHAQAEQLLRAALLVYQHNPHTFPLDVAATMHNLAISCRALARRGEAELLHLKAIDIIERTAGPKHSSLVLALGFLGVLYTEQGRLKEAEPLFIRSLQIGRDFAGPKYRELVPSLIGLASVQRLRGDSAAAGQSARVALHIAESAYGADNVRVAGVLHLIGQLDFEAGRLKKAEAVWRRALGIVQEKRAPDHPDALTLIVQLADIARLQNHYDEAEGLLTRAVRGSEQPGGGPLAVALHHLAVLYAKRNQHDRAEPLFRRSLAITERDIGSRNPEWALCASNLARTLVALKRPEEAERWTRSALEVIDQVNGTQHSFFIETLRGHAQILRKLGRKDEAKEAAARLETLRASGAGRASDYTISAAELRGGK